MTQEDPNGNLRSAEIIAFPFSNRANVEKVTSALEDAEKLFTKLQTYVVNLEHAFTGQHRTESETHAYMSAQGYVTHAIMQSKKLCDHLVATKKRIVSKKEGLSDEDLSALRTLIDEAVRSSSVAEQECMMQLRILHAKTPADDYQI